MQVSKVIEVGGAAARVLDSGTGDPVVVLHGWGGRIESMGPPISCLSQAFRVIALDLPGFGESPLPETTWGTPEYAHFVRSAIGELGIARAHFVGHSFGAKTSLYLAAICPDLVDKLVLIASSGLRRAPSLKVRAKRAASTGARALGRLGPPGEAAKQAIYKRLASRDYAEAGALRPILVKVVNEDLSALLPRIQSPTLLVWGSEDDAVPLSHARVMERLVPDAGLVVFEGAGHFAYLDDPNKFCRVVRHFFGTSHSA